LISQFLIAFMVRPAGFEVRASEFHTIFNMTGNRGYSTKFNFQK